MSETWPSVNYEDWSATCDTLHAHTQVLGKIALEVAPPEPELMHAGLRLTPRGWETLSLPAPDGSGTFAVTLDLRSHDAVIEHSGGETRRVALTPHRAVGEVTQEVLDAVRALAGTVRINPTPQEVWWEVALDADTEHATYDPHAAASYFAAATRAALVLSAFRAPFRGRSTPVTAWWGSFDLVVDIFSGSPADPPAEDFITRNAMDVETIAVGWWPGHPQYGKAAFYGFAHKAPENFPGAKLSPTAARWDEQVGEYLLDFDDVRASSDPHEAALEFARSVYHHAWTVAGWDSELAATLEGSPSPIR